MTEQKKNENRQALLRFADEMVEDILAASDEEVLAEFKEVYGDPSAFAEKMRAVSTTIAIEKNKERLVSSRRAMEAESKSRKLSTSNVDIQVARRALGKLLTNNTSSLPLTLAARKEKINEMSDNDVLGMVSDLETLGFVLRINNSGKENE